MGCQYLEDAYELFLLGTLPEAESAEICAHRERGCPHCLERLREAASIVYLLTGEAQEVRPERPSRKLKQNLLRLALGRKRHSAAPSVPHLVPNKSDGPRERTKRRRVQSR